MTQAFHASAEGKYNNFKVFKGLALIILCWMGYCLKKMLNVLLISLLESKETW